MPSCSGVAGVRPARYFFAHARARERLLSPPPLPAGPRRPQVGCVRAGSGELASSCSCVAGVRPARFFYWRARARTLLAVPFPLHSGPLRPRAGCGRAGRDGSASSCSGVAGVRPARVFDVRAARRFVARCAPTQWVAGLPRSPCLPSPSPSLTRARNMRRGLLSLDCLLFQRRRSWATSCTAPLPMLIAL